MNNRNAKLNKAEQAAGAQPPKRASRKSIRRKRIIKRVLGLVGILAVSAAVIIAAMKLLFVVRTQEVTGSSIFTQQEILEFVAIPYEENIFKVDSNTLEQQLYEEFTYIESAELIKRFPDRIEINITDCLEQYCALSGDVYTIYSQGFKTLRNTAEPPQGIVWLDIDMADEEKLGQVKDIIALFDKYNVEKVTKISVSQEDMFSFVYDDRIEVSLGTKLDMDYKIKMCKKILEEKIPEGEKGTIDATEGGEIVYKRQ